jgi:hypothetical protein
MEALPTDIRLGQKFAAVTNNLAYFSSFLKATKNIFFCFAPCSTLLNDEGGCQKPYIKPL